MTETEAAPTDRIAVTAVIAHRGASRLERENTVAAFERATAIGSDGVELDVRRTSDGALVVHHDPRLADGRVIVETRRDEIAPEVAGFDAALDACGTSFVNVEIKNIPGEPDYDPDDVVADAVVAELAARGGGSRWLLSSFRLATVARVRELLPTVRTAWLTTSLTREVIERTAAGGHDAIHPNVFSVDEATIRLAHRAGLAVNVWTCNDPERMRELISWGVDGICTDVPDVALAVRRELLG
jgi:glycerophosphoryl diester phosphodiesterase